MKLGAQFVCIEFVTVSLLLV